MDALNNEHFDNQSDTNDNVGQDGSGTQNTESGSDWESQAKYFQSEKDKLYSENQNLKKYEKIGQFLESRPDIVEKIKGDIDGGGKQQTEEPRIALDKDEFDPWEAYNDPSSKSYQFRKQEEADTINKKVNEVVGHQVSKMQKDIGMNKLETELDKRGLTPEQKKSFVEFASTNPADYGIDGYLKMWQAVNGESEQVQQEQQQSNPFDLIRQNKTQPQQGGILNGQQPERKSDDDMIWEQVKKAGEKSIW
jgi:hypothetical protein